MKKTTTSSKSKNITPIGDRVLIKPMSEEELSGNKKGGFGIILPDSMSKDVSGQGKVIALGKGKFVDGKLIPISVKVGDMVFYSKYSYDEVSLNDENYHLIKEDNLLAVIK